jgi:hypothetical protein
LIRFKTPRATNESSSLNPSKIRIVMCIDAFYAGIF